MIFESVEVSKDQVLAYYALFGHSLAPVCYFLIFYALLRQCVIYFPLFLCTLCVPVSPVSSGEHHLQQGALRLTREKQTSALRVPECRVGLSELITSVIFFFRVGQHTDKRKRHRIEGAQTFAIGYDTIHAIEITRQTPVL